MSPSLSSAEFSDSSSTYAIELTPTGRAAVAVVLVEGPNAVCAVEECFVTGNSKRLAEVPLDRITVGRWKGPDGEELVVCRRAPNRVEVHSHGGVAAVRSVLDALVTAGCQEISWRDWLRHSGAD